MKYIVKYIDDAEIKVTKIDKSGLSNLLMSLDCAGCEVIEIKKGE